MGDLVETGQSDVVMGDLGGHQGNAVL